MQETHDDIFAPDIEEELKIDFQDICEILDELEEDEIISKKRILFKLIWFALMLMIGITLNIELR